MKVTWFLSHVERCLEEAWNRCRVAADQDGDFSFRAGTAACYVSVVAHVPLRVRVWAVAAHSVKSTARLLNELNDANGSSLCAHVYAKNGLVIVEDVLTAPAVNAQALSQACDAVSQLAESLGGMIAAVFGGSTPFPPVEAPADDAEGAA